MEVKKNNKLEFDIEELGTAVDRNKTEGFR